MFCFRWSQAGSQRRGGDWRCGLPVADPSIARPDLKALHVFGHADDNLALAGRLPDGAVFLQKPFSVEALLDNVKKALGA